MKSFTRTGRSKRFVKVKKADGSWSAPIATPYAVEQPDEADEWGRQLQARIDAGFDAGGPLTVKGYYDRWIEKRDNASKADDESRMKLHVLPTLGAMPIADVRPRHIRDLVASLKRKMAPRTLHNVYAVLAAMMRDAMFDEVIRATPCMRGVGKLPKKRDADPEWRASAIFTRSELETIISHPKIPQDRRVFWALLFLTSSRFGEVSALRWRNYDATLKPLGRIVVVASYNTKLKKTKGTKTETPRHVPVHPVLAAILAEWKLTGYEAQYGKKPKPDDLMVPSREGRNRSVNHMLKRFKQDLDEVGLRHRRQHDTKRTFRSIALDDGANESRLSWITHGRKSTVEGGYDEPSWQALCECVTAMRLQRKTDFGAFGADDAQKSPDSRDRQENARA